ncbi:hypothetical protein X797_003534 [Metarhizium robertsii]|uniref:Proteinrelated to DNA damage-responsive protein 48 n=2 Tax=Metarhizium robertsii TaxID=568076 RepID=E9EUS2_METRA|nr:proteinrelated to DNA damage-responsive protein 48 [Metarhizium robertsii ARSEF 23]EFZ01175.1 proteinrelated to DNA damage-responsive protein 48 [Metarhizium robertsii ARSEF 23]EXV03735.1 hypothetical protein X797_003534 [Metarhizium robertsii]
MDFVKKVADGIGGSGNNQPGRENENNQGSNGSNSDAGAKLMDSFNSMAGGGKQGEANEDGLDKAVDFVQEKVLGEGDQSNESAAEQAKDEAISDFIRDKYKETTGKDFFVADKDKKYGL